MQAQGRQYDEEEWTKEQRTTAKEEVMELWANMSGEGTYKYVAIELAAQRNALREALKLFLEDERFQVMAGGNPNALAAMYSQARAALESCQ